MSAARLLLLSPATTTTNTPLHVRTTTPARLFLPTLRGTRSRVRPVTTCALFTDKGWNFTATHKSKKTNKEGQVETESTKIDIHISRMRVLLGAMLWAACFKYRFSFLLFLLVVASKSRMTTSVKIDDEDVEGGEWVEQGEGSLQIY